MIARETLSESAKIDNATSETIVLGDNLTFFLRFFIASMRARYFASHILYATHIVLYFVLYYDSIYEIVARECSVATNIGRFEKL